MASYFDEHDCEPLANGEAPNHLLHLARFNIIYMIMMIMMMINLSSLTILEMLVA